jgi:CHAT domain-containing protein
MDDVSSWLMALADPWSVGPHPSVLLENMGSVAEGLEQLLRGETGRARTTLDHEYQLAASRRDGGQALLALGLGWLAEIKHFDFLPGECGGGSVELAARWNGVERAQTHEAMAREAYSWPGASAVRPAYRWLQFIAGRFPALATVRDARDHPQKDLILQLHLQQFEIARDDARAVSSSAVGFVEWSIANLLGAARDRGRAEEAIARATDTYRVAHDEAGVASCLALRGDWLVAPMSSALVRNLMVADASFPASELAWMIEAEEGTSEGVDVRQARSLFEEARSLYERADNPRGVASLLVRLAYIARIEGQHDLQVELAEDAHRRFSAAGDLLHAELAKAHCLLARLDARRFPEDREAASTIGVWGAGAGSFSYALGLGLLFTRAGRQALLREGDYEKAEACFQLALSTSQALGTRCRQSQTYADLASLHQALGNRQRSQTHLEDSIETLLPETKIHVDSGVMQQRAALLIQQLYREALDHRDATGMERAIKRMADLTLQADGLPAFAVKSFLEVTRVQASVLIPLYKAVDQRNDGNEAGAERLFDNALGAAEHADPLNSKFLQAVVQATRRHYPEAALAFEEYQRAGAAQAGLAGSLISAMQGMSDSRAQQEVEIARRRSIEQAFSFMVRAKSYERAAAHLQELVQLAGDDWWAQDDRPWRSLSDIAEMHEGLREYKEALGIYEQAIEELEKRRSLLSRDELKTALAADFGVQYLYFQAVRAAMRWAATLEDLEERRMAERRAFALSEMGRARALLDLITSNLRISPSSTGESTESGRWRQLMSSSQLWRGMLARARASQQPEELVAALQLKIQACERELYQLEETIGRDSPTFVQATGAAAQLISIDEVVEKLAPDTAVLQYMTLGDDLLVWAITADGMTHASVIDMPAARLALHVRQLHENCASGKDLGTVKKQAEQLAKCLLDPVGPVIDKHERLIITPYGELNLLPFSALKWRDDWLGKQRTLSQLPSASMLLVLSRPRSTAAYPILIIGNPSHMSQRPPFGTPEELPRLEHAETEAKSVAKLYEVTALIGPDASIDVIRPGLSTHRQLHFATHGLLYDEAPLLSGVALANGYVLTVQELMGLKLDADLVIVSACKSGLGVRTGGEEIVGLTRGLLVAGARAVVVTLWSVWDSSTAMLMVRFHEHMKEGLDAPAALRLAQTWLSQLSANELQEEKSRLRDLMSPNVTTPVSTAHPQQWAPFVVIEA